MAIPDAAPASIAYGSITNFDTVNDTGKECHGFEIEIEDCHSTDITHTYNYNHYGVPTITEDNADPNHPKTVVRWESKKKPDGSWAAYTAIPDGPISPTNSTCSPTRMSTSAASILAWAIAWRSGRFATTGWSMMVPATWCGAARSRSPRRRSPTSRR
ncbi:MAG: hypothetical protein R3F11_09535 [Verrucomicrobiales bacterium]